jgi:hypothetical protein
LKEKPLFPNEAVGLAEKEKPLPDGTGTAGFAGLEKEKPPLGLAEKEKPRSAALPAASFVDVGCSAGAASGLGVSHAAQRDLSLLFDTEHTEHLQLPPLPSLCGATVQAVCFQPAALLMLLLPCFFSSLLSF